MEELEEVNGGYIVTPTVDGLTNGIKDMINIDNEINALGSNLKMLVSKNYLWSSAAKKHISVFKELIDIKDENR